MGTTPRWFGGKVASKVTDLFISTKYMEPAKSLGKTLKMTDRHGTGQHDARVDQSVGRLWA